MEKANVNPSDDKSAAPDGVVVQEPMAWAVFQPKGCEYDFMVYPDRESAEFDVGRDAEDEEQREIIPLYPLAAAPPPAAPDERLKGLRNEVLEEAAKACDAIWEQDAGTSGSDSSAACALAVRALKIGAAQKDKRIKAHGYRGIERRFAPSQGRAARRPESHQQAAQPEAAGQERGLTDPESVNAVRLHQAATTPAPAAPCAEGPSKRAIAIARVWLKTYAGGYDHLEVAEELLRWHEQTKKGT